MLSFLRFAAIVGIIPAAFATYSTLIGDAPWYAPLAAFGVTVWVIVFLGLLVFSTREVLNDLDGFD